MTQRLRPSAIAAWRGGHNAAVFARQSLAPKVHAIAPRASGTSVESKGAVTERGGFDGADR